MLRLIFLNRHSALLRCTACMAAVALLACASSAHAQVIEEGGFPVKGGGVSGESFSLSCPPRLVVEAGESVLFSCSATAVPEEGVRYEWGSLSGDGLHLLSDANERSPLFTAPLPGEGTEYVYRLTAMSVGVYETATVTVVARGVPGGYVQDRSKTPGLLEVCDSFGVLEGFREGCAEGKGPAPFGFDPEAEGGFLFPEAPGLPDRPSGPVRGGGFDRQAPPRLECPVAVFLGELETGVIECHASDAAAEEFLEYMWEPVGSTTRDYLDNPRLLPEDSPMPSVVAPEAPVYETLESFRSGERTFRYRYRLTVTSRATGLSSLSEVEVYVSSSRPDVYCPLEIVVEEGSTVALDCEGVDPLSGRMDYDEDGASIEWEWKGLWGTSTAHLDETDLSSPVFEAPVGSASKQYHYIASMTSSASGEPRTARRRVTVSVVGGEGQAMDDVSAPGAKAIAPSITCEDAEIYEATGDFTLDCTAQDEPAGATYVWTGTDISNRLSGTDSITPTFSTPGDIDEPDAADKDYDYTVTMTAGGVEQASKKVTVTVLEKPDIWCARSKLGYEGGVSPGGNHRFDPCPDGFQGAPAGSDYAFDWIPVRTLYIPEEAALAALDRTDMQIAVFTAPTESPSPDVRMYYTYRLKASAENADPVTLTRIGVSVVVRNRPEVTVTCSNSFYEVDEGDPDFDLEDCSASGAWFEHRYTWQWSPTANLTGHDTGAPTFNVPGNVDRDTTYAYRVRVSSRGHHPDEATVEVTVLDRAPLALVCTSSYEVYEGSEDIAFACEASGVPEGSSYAYLWTARGGASDTALLSATDIASPLFYVPDAVTSDETHEYLLTASAVGVRDATEEVSVTVLDRGSLAVVCTDPPSVYEGSEDFDLDCSASGGAEGSAYEYVWTARGSTPDVSLLSASDIASPTFYVPDNVDEDETYEYLLTVSAENAVDGVAEVTVTVLNKRVLALACADPGSVYEGSDDVAFDCTVTITDIEAPGAPGDNPQFTYAWTARGDTPDTALLSATDIASPTFYVPDEVDENETYEYLLTVSAENTESGSAAVTVTVLNRGALSVVCADPGSVYEGLEDIAFACEASGAPGGSSYAYLWTARGGASDTALLSATDIASPLFYVPDAVTSDETHEYTLTVSAQNAEDATADVTVTVLDRAPLALVCTSSYEVYEGSEDIAFACEASGVPEGSSYAYLWTARGGASDTALLSATDIASPLFYVPDAVTSDETHEYTLTVSAQNAEDATADVTVTVLDRVQTPPSDPVSPPVASSSVREPSVPTALGVTASASSLDFGVQSADTEVSLDPMTDGISTHVSGPYHAGRMTLASGGGEVLDENGEMDLSIELASPVTLRREGGIEAASIDLSPSWSLAESCEQLSSQAVGGLYTEVTLSEDACRLLRFGGELDLTGVPSGHYAGSMDIILRSGESEETHTVAVDVTVIPAQQVITTGPGGVRFSTSRELPVGLTEEQNLSIYPHVAFLTGEKPNGVFELSNPSLIPLEISVSARFGYTEATANGREVVVEDASGSPLGDLSSVVDIHPGVLVLQPGEKGLVRYGMQEGVLAAMAEKGYAAFFDVVSAPRQYVRTDQMPEEVAGDRTARVTMRVPGVYVPGEGASQLRAALLSISYVSSLSATFLVETADHPFVGEVVAYDGDGRELGRRETLVYTRSRVRIPLDRMPEEGAVFLRFSPRGSGRVPEPASVEWDAPRRDIGAADKALEPESTALSRNP